MRAMVETIEAPAGSEISRRLDGAYYHDSYRIAIPPSDASALELYLRVARQTPGWVNWLMDLRNRLAGLVGLKNLGALNGASARKPASDYRVGDRVGIFDVRYLTPDEVILGDTDKHLKVEVSVCKTDGALNVSTVVHLHNLLGRLYMVPVAPLHKVIVRSMLRRAGGLNA
jgi:hypothetical protein